MGDLQGNVVAGDTWINFDVPATGTAEFHSQEHDGVTYRVAVLKAETYGAGEMVVMPPTAAMCASNGCASC